MESQLCSTKNESRNIKTRFFLSLKNIQAICRIGLSCALFFAALAAHGAEAAPRISAQREGAEIVFSETLRGYEAEELVEPELPVHVRLDKDPVKIEMREVYQGAVGDEGPWMDVPGAVLEGAWVSLAPARDFDLARKADEEMPDVAWPKAFDCAGPEFEGTAEDCVRWSGLYAKCDLLDGFKPCYTYFAGFEIKVYYAEGAAPETIFIRYPGGC